jgi:hypothetical protein
MTKNLDIILATLSHHLNILKNQSYQLPAQRQKHFLFLEFKRQ